MVAVVLSAGLGFLPLGAKLRFAAALETSVFIPFRLTAGWGARAAATQSEVRRLRQQLTERSLTAEQALDARSENERLRRMVGFRRRGDSALLPAGVVGRELGRFGEALIIETADPAAAQPGRPVIGPDGLVGRVAARQGSRARVECLRNFDLSVSVLNERSREGGILKWNPAGRPDLVIGGIPSQADWQPGDRLITSGLGTAFPRGLLVGWIEGDRTQRGGLLKDILVRPAARVERASEVYLLVTRDEAEGWPEGETEDVSPLYPPEGRYRSAHGGPGMSWAATGPKPTP